MSNQGSSPFCRSQLMHRSPPSTPKPQPVEPIKEPPLCQAKDLPSEVITTTDIQKWMSSIDGLLNEVCAIVADGKMNTDQKMRVTNVCRKIGSGASQMAVLYQSLKQKTVLQHATIQHLRETQDVACSIDQFKSEVKEKLCSQERTSFADMVKKGADKFVRPSKISTLAIYPSDKTKTSEETKTLVQKIISPEDLKLHVRGLRKVGNGGVLISTESKGDIEKLKQSEKLASSGLKLEEPARRNPRITILGVPAALSETEVLEYIYLQNLADMFPDASRESCLKAIKISHKSGKKGLPTCNYILEVSANIRKALINHGRIFINWTSCPVRDFTLVTRCFNCQQFGHAAKYCRETSPVCSHCGESGHTFKECNNKSAAPTCATCKRFKRTSDHRTGDASCPARKYAEDRYINSIDYEGALER